MPFLVKYFTKISLYPGFPCLGFDIGIIGAHLFVDAGASILLGYQSETDDSSCNGVP